MNFKTKSILGITMTAVLALAGVSLIGIQDVAADGNKIWKFFKKFTKKADFVAKMDTSQIPDEHRLFDDRSKTGMGKFSFDEDRSKLEYTIKVNDLDLRGVLTPDDASDDVTKIHIHQAPVGIPGPHVFNVLGAPCEPDLEVSFFAKTGTVTGAWDDNDDIREDDICVLGNGPASESLTEKLKALCNGELYVNIHTTHAVTDVGDNGEIRGQIEPTKSGKRICERLGLETDDDDKDEDD